MNLSERKRNISARLHSWFPDREFFMRAQGQVKFLKISSKFQIRAFLTIVVLAVIWLVVTLAMAISQYSISLERLALSEREAAAVSSESRVAQYRDSIDDVAADLQKRQEQLENTMQRYFPAAQENAENATTSENNLTETEAKATITKVSALIPEAKSLALIEARQLVFVEHLSKMADNRSKEAETAIRKMGLDPDLIADANSTAQGGPFLSFFGRDKKADTIDPRFELMGRKLARMDALERGLSGIPSSRPADMSSMSSGFGYRRDPFTGRGAMHSGLDFRGSRGQAIYAAASGNISFAGWKSGYGKTIEITHGNGLMTRYAHLSSIAVQQGQPVKQGAKIAGMGSTGRSTGTHLHFEVRLNNRAINPKPFLEANRDVLKIKASAQHRTDSGTNPS